MYCMIVLVMVFPPNRWYIVKSACVTGRFPSQAIHGDLIQALLIHTLYICIGLPHDGRGNSYNSWNIYHGWIDHLQCWYTQSGLYQMPQTEYRNSNFRSWIYIKKLVLVTYSMTYYGMVSVVPFLVIIIAFASARTTDQIWWCPLRIPHFCGIFHLLTYKLSLVEQGVRSPPNNLYYLNLLFNHQSSWCPDHMKNTMVRSD